MRLLIPVLALPLAAIILCGPHPAYGQAPPALPEPIDVPPECQQGGAVDCVRLTAGQTRRWEQNGMCVILTSRVADDLFIPARSMQEMTRFLEEPNGLADVTPCPLP